MLDDNKPIKPKEIVENPDDIYRFTRSHIILRDSITIFSGYSTMLDAICILYDKGWEVVGTSSNDITMLVIMKNTNYKPKNMP